LGGFTGLITTRIVALINVTQTFQTDEIVSAAEKTPTEVLFPEAKRRERHRRLIVLVILLAIAGVTAGLIAASGGSSPPNAQGTKNAGNGGSPVGLAGHLTFRGNGIGTAQFGQPESVAIVELKKVLGAPLKKAPTATNLCAIDAYLEWTTMDAYFSHGRFVGYGTAILGGFKYRRTPNWPTAAGLRIGDTLAQAKKIYGKSITISYAQGGSWFATTSTGTVRGYLTAVPGHPTPPFPRIADVTAGSVGCPAASP
jgi:hypothetical protein